MVEAPNPNPPPPDTPSRPATQRPFADAIEAAMTGDDVIAAFLDAGALMEGHFILSSGLHSPRFIQKMRVFEDPVRAERLCRALAGRILEEYGAIDVVVSPALGGIIPGYETARALGCRAVFVEREAGVFQLRRGFELRAGERAVIVEDIVTTGLSARECIAAVRAHPVELVGAACLLDRSNGTARLDVSLLSLCRLDIPAYPADALPPELAAIPAVKPGSRASAA